MSFSLRSLRSCWLPTSLALALGSTAVACDDGTDTSSDDITDVKNSSVKNQSIGNCWVYATSGWAESLHLSATAQELNLSESWLSYWHWYEQIAGAPPGQFRLSTLSKDELSTGGWHGLAVELMRRYGVLEEGRFVPEEAEAARSSRQSSALNAINASLKSGELSDPAKRRDRKLVRRELDKAWGLNESVTAMMDQVFGEDVSRTLYRDGASIPVDSGLMYPKEISVGRNITLADVIGEPASTFGTQGFLRRRGKYAWDETNYPSSPTARRDFLRRGQRAMHAGMPVIMTWFVDFAAMDDKKRFVAPPATPGRQGGHMTVLEDYQAKNVPGFGTLEAGQLVTDPKALEALLAPETQIEFFRVKNSWGTALAPNDSGEEFRGYHDLYMEYLNGPLTRCTESNGDKCGIKSNVSGLTAFVLPPEAFMTDAQWDYKPGGTCSVDLCLEGPALSTEACPSDGDKTACIELVCENDDFCCTSGWDDLCVSAAKECGLDSCQ